MSTDGGLIEQSKKEVLTLSRFTLVGLVATGVHMAIVLVLIRYLNFRPYGANLIAFLSAFSISFAGQYFWTFRSDKYWLSALKRFFLISLTAFLLNNFVLALLINSRILSAEFSALLSACVIPLVTYVLGRFWAFK